MSHNYYGQRSVSVSAFGVEAVVSVEFEVVEGECETTAMWVDEWAPKDVVLTGPQHSALMRIAEDTFMRQEGWKNEVCGVPQGHQQETNQGPTLQGSQPNGLGGTA